MFDAIARRYDTLNHLLSAGPRQALAPAAVRELALTGRERVLDMCTGTADLAIRGRDVPGRRGAGSRRRGLRRRDAPSRLRQGARRAASSGGFIWSAATRRHVPLPDASSTPRPWRSASATSSIPGRAPRVHRVLRPGGRLAILEFGAPTLPGLRQLYAWYFRARAAADRPADLQARRGLRYLPASVQQFPSGEAFDEMLRRAGFSQVRHDSLTLGVVYLYVARKP